MKKIVGICFIVATLFVGATVYTLYERNKKAQLPEVVAIHEEKLSKDDIKQGIEKISQEYAKKIMDSDIEFVLLDVRSQSEYDEKHLKGSVLIPDTEIEERVLTEIPNKDELILVYCRSGNRSGKVTTTLSKLGYSNVKDFGGLNAWEYETEN